MGKIAIIGLGLVGNSIGMALRRAGADGEADTIVGFDPDREKEQIALRRYGSVDEIAPSLEAAVQGAELVIISTPPGAVHEVLGAIAPFLEEGATVTDTLASKEQVLAWAGELLPPGAGFVGGHPISTSIDLETAAQEELPNPDLFVGAPYPIIPLQSAGNQALALVIRLAETLGARPLFMDAREHDSFVAAVSHLPSMASAALLGTITKSPAWADMSALAHTQFRSVSQPLTAEPKALSDALLGNRQLVLRWIDQYVHGLYELRQALEQNDQQAVLEALTQAHEARAEWDSPESGSRVEKELRAELHQAIENARPGRNLMGSYLTEKLFRRREGKE